MDECLRGVALFRQWRWRALNVYSVSLSSEAHFPFQTSSFIRTNDGVVSGQEPREDSDSYFLDEMMRPRRCLSRMSYAPSVSHKTWVLAPIQTLTVRACALLAARS